MPPAVVPSLGPDETTGRRSSIRPKNKPKRKKDPENRIKPRRKAKGRPRITVCVGPKRPPVQTGGQVSPRGPVSTDSERRTLMPLTL